MPEYDREAEIKAAKDEQHKLMLDMYDRVRTDEKVAKEEKELANIVAKAGHNFDFVDAVQWAMTNAVREKVKKSEAPHPAYFWLWETTQGALKAKFMQLAFTVLGRIKDDSGPSDEEIADVKDIGELEEVLRGIVGE